MNFKLKRFKLDIKTSIAVILAASIFTAYLMFKVSPGYSAIFFTVSLSEPLVLFLNYIPILLIMLIFYFISGNCIFASGFSAIIFTIGSYANEQKSNLRQDPLIPSDMSVITEVKSILSDYDDKYTYLAIATLIAIILVCLIAFIFFKRSEKLTVLKRAVGTFCCIFCFAGLLNTVYASSSLYDSFEVNGNIYFKVNQYASKGFLYSFLYDINNLKVEKPEGYNSAEFLDSESEVDYDSFDDTAKPNIVMVMSEAFSDISNSDFLSFDGFDNPLEFFNEFVTRDDVISGHIVVPNFGGGTSDTEFDVLTGCSTRHIESTQVSYNFIRQPIESIPRLLENIGYDTLAIHPGYGWFYNRVNVYDNMGFDDFLYLEEDFDPATQNKGGYISDEATAQSIIDNFEKHTEESDNPLFEFCVTIQNHGPYEDKYENLETNFSTDIYLTDEEKKIYSGYFEGIDDADAQIETLVNYFENSDEPVVFIFFGDHLPGFSNGMDYFTDFRPDIDLNGDQWQLLRAYETPYFIWANDAALEMTNFEENAENIEMPPTNTMSSFYLGSTLLELLDLDGISPFFEYVNNMRTMIPIAFDNLFMYQDGTLTTELPADTIQELDYYKKWVYYKIFDEEVM